MKRPFLIGLFLLLAMAACHTPTREAKRMAARAKALAETVPDSTIRLIDSIFRMEANLNERQRMDLALLQGEALFRDAPLDDDDFEDTAYRVPTTPELERAADYYAKKRQYAKAAHAALYSGYVQQHYDEKETAMRSFKAAEQYGLLANDSLTVARAEYRMGKMLFYEGRKQEALSFLSVSISHVGNRMSDLATIEIGKGSAHILLNQFDSAEICFHKSYLYAEKGLSAIAKHKTLNNLAVLYRIQDKNVQAISCLKQMDEPYLTSQEKAAFYLNMGKSFAALGEADSVVFYFQRLKDLLEVADVKKETRISAYEALFRFAESQHDALALQYHEKHKEALFEVMNQQQEQTIYRIQQQFNYESLQNQMSRKIIRRHQIILVISILLLVFFGIILVLQYRNKQLLQAEEKMNQQIESMKQELSQSISSTTLDGEVASRLKLILAAKHATKRAKDPKNEWQPLVKQVMNGQENLFDAARTTIETVYPHLYQTILEKHPQLTETEAKVCLLSCSDLSNAEMAELLNLRPNTVNQNRSTLRRKLNLNSNRMKEQLRNMLFN